MGLLGSAGVTAGLMMPLFSAAYFGTGWAYGGPVTMFWGAR